MTNTTTSGPEIHASVLQFLLNHGYMESVEAFKREARHQLDLLSSDESTDVQLINRLSQLQIQRRVDELKDGDGDYFTTLTSDLLDIHYSNILTVAIEPQTHILATSSIDKTVKISTMLCKSNTQIAPRTYSHHQAPVLSIEFHPRLPQLMLTTSMDGTSALVNVSFEESLNDQEAEKVGLHQLFRDHKKYVVRGLFSPVEGKYIATASYDRTVCIYSMEQEDEAQNLPNYKLIKQVGPFIGNVETICFVDEITLVIGVRDDNYLHYLNLETMQQERINMNSTGDDWVSFSPVYISVSSDGSQLLCTTDHDSGRTILFATGESRQLQNYYINATDNKFITRRHVWHPSGLYFYATGSDDNTISVVETKSGRVITKLAGHKAMIRSLVLDSELGLISAGYDHSVKLWSKPLNNLLIR
ncbi:WD40-repeat-containing domain protein [Cokeromyces recurvatus]|uniref:WD40-repeat-containing domain protein n=1 Tax=Cokeromyces recurvatus TaxID=90255 RepID=UPI00221F6B20|nr:WD40-repeat-containing domain protein [Cokeromyces recurvatus]KAI7900801.1 WD40-repeat-containing domain protein [Cokeromyces recurvatus]